MRHSTIFLPVFGLSLLATSLTVLADPTHIPPQMAGTVSAFGSKGSPVHCHPPFTPAQLRALKCSEGLGSGFSLTDWKAPLKVTLPKVEAALRKAGFVVEPFTPPAYHGKGKPASVAGKGLVPDRPGAVLLVSRPHWQKTSAQALWQSLALSPVAVDLVQVRNMTWSAFGKRSFLALHSPAFGLAQSFDAKLKAALRSVPGSLYPHQKQTAPAK